MLSYPKSVTILGRKFKIVFKEDLSYDGKIAAGITDFDAMTIFIDPNINERSKFIVLFHEITHVALDVTGLDQVFPDTVVECLCQTIGNTFYDIVMSFCGTNEWKIKGMTKAGPATGKKKK